MATMTVTVTQQSPTAALATFGEHEVVMEHAQANAGADTGQVGGEWLLAALGGCFMGNLLAAIRARDLPIHAVKTTVIGTLAKSPSRFTSIELQVTAQCENVQMLAKVVTIAERGCVIANTLRNAVDLRVTTISR